jgi:diguanylate cyclase (GGDEF)-like protein
MEEINVLVIEDKSEEAIFLESTLQSQGYKVWVDSTGEEAVRLFKTAPFAVVFTELHMLGMNGIEITKELIKIRPNVSVIVITAYPFISSAIEAMEAGAYGYITKPFNPTEINIVLERAIERFYFLSSDEEKKQFAELSIKDPLTGVYNRRFLKIYIPNKISSMKRVAEKFSILLIDIDYFKKYNDTNGRLAGDKLLREMCELFKQSLRNEDIIFRYGGEEFLIFLDHADKSRSSMVAERIRNLVNLSMPTTVSIGVGIYPDDGWDLDELIANVDKALYKAKESGRNKVCLL